MSENYIEKAYFFHEPYQNDTPVSQKIKLGSFEGFFYIANGYNKVKLEDLVIFFYHEVPIACVKNDQKYIVKNEGGYSGLGRALNLLDRDKSKRLEGGHFVRILENFIDDL